MNALPIIERELRAQARTAFTFGLRMLGAGALLLVWLYYGFNSDYPAVWGGRLFGYLNCAVFLSIWIVVPLLSADSISRERREGTLGLLFLTPLKAREIVLAKGLVHGLRALTLWLATMPILTIAFLVGGVTWREAVLSALVNFSSICWALAAGLLGSCLTRARVRALLFAGLLASGFLVFFAYLTGFGLLIATVGIGRTPGQSMSLAAMHERALYVGLFGATDMQGWWGMYLGTLTKAGQKAWLLAQGRLALVSVAALLVAVGVAAWNMRRIWQEKPSSDRQVWLEEKFCTPILWVSFFRRWMRRKLEKNPIGWLEQRTWSGRLVMWGWFAVMISLYSVAFNAGDMPRLMAELQQFMAWLLLGVMAVSAAGSFHRERETGVLELLLVSPLSEGQIIGGRLRGLWGQFFPALALLLGVWTYLAGLFPEPQRGWGMVQFYCSSFLALPVIGLYCSLRRRNFISAFLFTVFLGLVVPFGLKLVLNALSQAFFGVNGVDAIANNYASSGLASSNGISDFILSLFDGLLVLTYSNWFPVLVQGIIAVRVGRRLYYDLARRNFAFSRTVN